MTQCLHQDNELTDDVDLYPNEQCVAQAIISIIAHLGGYYNTSGCLPTPSLNRRQEMNRNG